MSSGHRRVAMLGECMIELRQEDGATLTSSFAGDTLNTATYLRRLLPQKAYEVHYVTALGHDPLSAQMTAAWNDEGIVTKLVRRMPGALPGLYLIRTDADGEREFYYWRQVSAARQVLDDGYAGEVLALLADGDLFYVSGITAAILPPERRNDLYVLLAGLKRQGVRIAYDTNFRARLWQNLNEARDSHQRMLEAVDILITSGEDEAALYGDVDIDATVQRIAALDIAEWVVRGAPGVTITRADGRSAVSPIDPARVVDTTGAGDSFDAAYLAARLAGHSPRIAVNAAHALAAIVVQQGGAIITREHTPWLDELLPA